MRKRRMSLRMIAATNPVPDSAGPDLVSGEWSEGVLRDILAQPSTNDANDSAFRGRRTNRRRWALVPAVLMVLGLGVSSAFGLHRQVIDFFGSEPAPTRLQKEFGALEVASPGGSGPELIPNGARKVIEAELQGRRRTLWVAPTTSGGFCWAWPDLLMKCTDGEAKLGVSRVDTRSQPGLIGGHVLEPATQRLELRYEDGTSTEIQFVWISAPIDAGLFYLEVPRERLAASRRPEALVALDQDGEEIARYRFLYSDPAHELAPDGLPRLADRSQKRTLIAFRGASGEEWKLVAAPAPGNRLCYVYNLGSGCVASDSALPNLNVGVQNAGDVVIVFGTVDRAIKDIELRFEDGTRMRIEAAEGFVLWEIPASHFAPGSRLKALVGYDDGDQEVERKDIPTQRPGVYPCGNPEDIGHDVKTCP